MALVHVRQAMTTAEEWRELQNDRRFAYVVAELERRFAAKARDLICSRPADTGLVLEGYELCRNELRLVVEDAIAEARARGDIDDTEET